MVRERRCLVHYKCMNKENLPWVVALVMTAVLATPLVMLEAYLCGFGGACTAPIYFLFEPFRFFAPPHVVIMPTLWHLIATDLWIASWVVWLTGALSGRWKNPVVIGCGFYLFALATIATVSRGAL